MEALRLEGNALFATDPEKAATHYLAAVALYEDDKDTEEDASAQASKTLDEFTKSAGNALTCLFKVGHTEACASLAKRVLRTNPILAKANAFYGRCLLLKTPVTTATASDSLMYLCRAMYELPSLESSARSSVTEAIEKLCGARDAALASLSADGAHNSYAVRVAQGACGNGVCASAAIPPGVAISTTRAPFSVAPYEEFSEGGCCVHCGVALCDTQDEATRAPAPLSCAQCGLVWFCSQTCQAAHASQHTDFECATLQKLRAMLQGIEARQLDVPDEFFELAFHCVTTIAAWRAKKPGHEQLLHLEAHADEVAQNLHPTLPMVCELFPDLDGRTVATVLGVIRCNALEVADSSGMGVGQALHCGGDTITSYFNHACAPNCAIDTVAHCIRTTRFIQPDEELTIAYLPQLYYPTKLRQDILKEHFFFTCRCLRCLGTDGDAFERAIQAELPGQTEGVARRFHASVQQLCSRVRGARVEVLSDRDITEVEKMLADVKAHVFSFHYLCHELRNTLSFLYAALGKPRACLTSCLEELLMWESIMPGALPVKQMKLHNALRCVEEMTENERETLTDVALFPHLTALAKLYGVE